MRRKSILPFVALVIAWLVPALAVWWVATPLLAWPVARAAELVSRAGFGDLVQSVEQHEDHSGEYAIVFITSLKPARASTEASESGVMSVESNFRKFAFGLPMLFALVLAARQPHPWRKLLIAYAVLAPFETWGVVCDFLKQIAFDGGPDVASQTGFNAAQREAIAFAYQFGVLILPTVAPAVFWVLAHRRFLECFGAPRQA